VTDMLVVREGSKLKLDVHSGIGYFLTFTHECSTEANAEAWLRHVKAHYEKQDQFNRNRVDNYAFRNTELENEIERLKRRVRYHKRKAACAKPSP
jgi:hypothetical protein